MSDTQQKKSEFHQITQCMEYIYGSDVAKMQR